MTRRQTQPYPPPPRLVGGRRARPPPLGHAQEIARTQKRWPGESTS